MESLATSSGIKTHTVAQKNQTYVPCNLFLLVESESPSINLPNMSLSALNTRFSKFFACCDYIFHVSTTLDRE